MTTFSDEISSGIYGLASAQSTRAGTLLIRQRRFTGGGNQTWSGLLPYDAVCVNASLYINAQGSATTSDRITFSTSAGSTPLVTFTQVGSATGIIDVTTVGLGVKTVVASACYSPAPSTNPQGAEVPFQVLVSSNDAATDYGIFISFRRRFAPGT